MPVFDCRPTPEPGSRGFGARVKIIDPATGEKIPNVFYANTAPAQVGRFVTGPDGEPLASRRRSKTVRDGRGGFSIKTDYDRLEVWEFRRWKAIDLTTGAVVAESHDG